MLYFEIVAEIVLLFAFFYGAIKLWKRGKPLYFQIIIAAIGCYALYQLLVIVITLCDINEIFFNDGFFGLTGCFLLLFCANHGSLEKIFDKPKLKFTIISIFVGVLMFALSIVVGLIYFGELQAMLFIFLLEQIPACLTVFYNVKHLFTPVDNLGLIKGLRLVDIFSITFSLINLLDMLAWTNPSLISGVADVVLALIALLLSLSAIKGAEKWNY